MRTRTLKTMIMMSIFPIPDLDLGKEHWTRVVQIHSGTKI